MIYSQAKNNTILDNIHLNGNWLANNGIYITLSGNSTINNIESYNNTIWILLNSVNYVTISNSASYDNTTFGIHMYFALHNIITGSKANNNFQHGILLQNSQYNIFDNIETANNMSANKAYWIYLFASHNNQLNTINSYNNYNNLNN